MDSCLYKEQNSIRIELRTSVHRSRPEVGNKSRKDIERGYKDRFSAIPLNMVYSWNTDPKI
jgi:hypothetical protein